MAETDDCMARRIKHHMDHADRHIGGREQAIAIAASECGIAKNASHEGEACYESQVPVGTFTATDKKINIKGGDYKWRSDGDGYFTVLDVPLVSEWKKGDHGAPYDGDKATLAEFVATAQRRYQAGHFCASAYKGHNPDPEMPIPAAQFRGYVLPNRVGKYTLEQGEKWTIFGDIKLEKAGFDEWRAGRLPYLSVEIPWSKRRIRGLSFQDTLPPEYEYALFTSGEEVKDATAKFEVDKDSVAKFMEDESPPKNGEDKKPEADVDDQAFDERVGRHMAKHFGSYVAKYAAGSSLARMADPVPHKPSAMPVEPEKGAKMTDPEMAAKFTALAAANEDLKARLDKQDHEKIAAKFVVKAEQGLSTKIITPGLREQIAGFAAEWAPAKDGEAKFDKYVEALKPSLKDKPSLGTVTGATVDMTDPVVAKFAQQGPDAMEEAGKFAAQWKGLKSTLGDRFGEGEEDFVKREIALAKAKREGFFRENGR